jgi:hypothetical protein
MEMVERVQLAWNLIANEIYVWTKINSSIILSMISHGAVLVLRSGCFLRYSIPTSTGGFPLTATERFKLPINKCYVLSSLPSSTNF